MSPVDVSGETFVRTVVDAVLSEPARLMVWGLSDTSARLLATLRRLGLESAVVAVVDERPGRSGVAVAGWTTRSPDDVVDWGVTHLAVGLDAEKEIVLRAFAARCEATPVVLTFGQAQYEFRDETFWELVNSSYVKSLTGGYKDVLIHVYQCLRHVVDNGLEGDVAEFGVHKGGTTIFMARLLRRLKHDCMVLGFDTFSGFPAKRSVLDTYVYERDEFFDFDVVQANCALYGNIELIPGDISETFVRLKGRSLSFSFFDTDNYSAARRALPLCAEATVPGGIIAFDHYHSPDWPTPLGERMAAQDTLLDGGWFNLHGTGIFMKTRP